MKPLLELSVAPHIRDGESVNKIMWSVVIALLPAFIAALALFGMQALRLVTVSVTMCVVTEFVIRRLRRRDTTIMDGSAVITGMLLAFVVPPTLPTWMIALGAMLAIFLVKELFGGLGANIFNPALAARAILLAAFPRFMTTWISPFEGVSTATPLALVKERIVTELPSYYDLFIGQVGGSLGETSALALILGGLFLIVRGIIRWEIPLINIAAVFCLSVIVGRDPVYEILAGGVILGAFFMITDMVTTPLTRKGGIVFALGCAIITVAIRQWGGYPEGVCYSILIMNAFTPLIDRWCVPRRLGQQKNSKKKG
ncbi:MAG: RnfABCDGE type electron transport complex subunit D [Candidatus Omnitrophica bacterium]|nr:RnfABCDGE type electron transport complex subunit D [Candidatus Omnitrophota bacterium]